MNVSIKKFDVDMEIKNNGIELEVHDNNNNHLGDLVITKTGLTWCKGRTTVKNGVNISWEDFTSYMEDPA